MINRAKSEMAMIVSGVEQYYNTYSRSPVPADVSKLIVYGDGRQDDITYGGQVLNPGNPRYERTNSELMSILMDYEKFPNTGGPTLNAGHVKNVQQIKFISPKMTDNVANAGVGPDLVYRDPWGNPYVISVDLNMDDKVRDSLYCQQGVSMSSGDTGFFGLFRAPGETGDEFKYNGRVMVWSKGPDGKYGPAAKANAVPNRDNVLSWQ